MKVTLKRGDDCIINLPSLPVSIRVSVHAGDRSYLLTRIDRATGRELRQKTVPDIGHPVYWWPAPFGMHDEVSTKSWSIELWPRLNDTYTIHIDGIPDDTRPETTKTDAITPDEHS